MKKQANSKKKTEREKNVKINKIDKVKFGNSDRLISPLLDCNQCLLQTNHELVSQCLTRNECSENPTKTLKDLACNLPFPNLNIIKCKL